MNLLARSLVACIVICAFAIASRSVRAGEPDDLGAVYLALGRGDITLASTLAEDYAKQHGQNDRHQVAALWAQFDVHNKKRDLSKFASSLQEGIRTSPPDPKARVLLTCIAAAADLEMSKPSEALQKSQQALNQRIFSDDEDRAELYRMETRALAESDGRLADARATAEQALAIWRRYPSTPRRAWREIELYWIIASIKEYTGSKALALKDFEVGAQLVASVFGAESASRIKFDNERAVVLVALGRNDEALQLRERSFESASRHFGASSPEVVMTESLLAAGLSEVGDYAAAYERYLHVEQALAQIPASDLVEQRALVATNFGNLLEEIGKDEEALPRYEHALALLGDRPGVAHARAIVYSGIGYADLHLGRLDAAIYSFSTALALRTKADGENASGLSFALEGLGFSSLALGHYAEAKDFFSRALTSRGKALPPNHPTLASLNFGLALAYWRLGQGDEAFQYAKKTAEYQLKILSSIATEFSERQRVAFRATFYPAISLVVTLAAERGDPDSIETAWSLSAAERGLFARAQVRRFAAVRAASDPLLSKAWKSWNESNDALADALMAADRDAQRIQTLQAETEHKEHALWHGAEKFTETEGILRTANMASALPQNGVLLAYTKGLNRDGLVDLVSARRKSVEDWYVFALKPNEPASLRRVGSIAEISTHIHDWYAGVRNPEADLTALTEVGLGLRKTLLDPVMDLRSTKTLFVVPDGDLFRVSFSALPADKDRYLVESGIRVHVLDDERDLVLPPQKAAARAVLLAGAPAFAQASRQTGDADQASRSLCLRAKEGLFKPLPHAQHELDHLHELLAASSGNSKYEVIETSGREATKEKVLSELSRANIVHIATHGFSSEQSCSISNNWRYDPNAAAASTGLALSAANSRGNAHAATVLTAAEIAALDLSRTEWVALSSCDSGLGPLIDDEGVFGLRRALRFAGAGTVVMSLWEVDDAATADLMYALYKAHFAEHADVPDSMARAMQTVLAARRASGQSAHPYYWGAFVSEGAWRP